MKKIKYYFKSTKKLARLTIVLVLVEIFLVMSGVYLLYECNHELQEAEYKREYYMELAEDMGESSDYLTKQARYFSVTGDIEYFDNYWKEVKITKTRDKVLDELEKSNIPVEEGNILSNAKSLSDSLIDLEIHSMQYTLRAYEINAEDYKNNEFEYESIKEVIEKKSWKLYEQNEWQSENTLANYNNSKNNESKKDDNYALKEKGINILFSNLYKQYKNDIDSYVKAFRIKMNERLNGEVIKAEQQEKRTIVIQICFVISEIFIMIFLIELFRKLFIKPVENYTTEIERSNVKYLPQVKPEGVWELVYFGKIFNQLSNNLASELKFHKEAEKKMRAAKEQADEANRIKGDFVSMVSHEIRTPLHAIIGYLDLLEDTNLRGKQVEYVKNAQLSTDILLSEINDILDFSKIEAGKFTIENQNFDIKDIIQELKSVVINEAKVKNLDLIFEIDENIPEYLIGSPSELRRILLNLLYNGIKFTAKGFIKLRIVVSKVDNGKYTFLFEVEDTGIGIKEEMQKKIFEAFLQSDASITRKYGGTGLGLAISKRLVEIISENKYTIVLKSKEGYGSTFSFLMEFREGVREEKEKRVKVEGFNKNVSVLLVDDQEMNLKVEKEIFKKMNCTVDTENNPKKVLERIKNKKYDIVFLDISMPEISGFELASEIRKNEEWNNIILVALSANVGKDVKEKARESGMKDFLEKPFHKEELIEFFERYHLSKLEKSDSFLMDEKESIKCLSGEVVKNSENEKFSDVQVEKFETEGKKNIKIIKDEIKNFIYEKGRNKGRKVKKSKVYSDGDLKVKDINLQEAFEIVDGDLKAEDINLQEFLELVDGDSEAVKRILTDFRNQNKGFIDLIKKLLEEERDNELRDELHRMEGVVGNLRCVTLLRSIKKLHREVKDKMVSKDTINNVEKEFEKVIEFINVIIKKQK